MNCIFQPDVNMRNSEVVAELNDILEFWMKKGVDGFRVDAIAHAFEHRDFLDAALKDQNLPGYKWNLFDDFTYEYKG